MPKPGKTVAVIGAGLGGLSAAISLRAEGFNVQIFEKNAHAGGKLNLLEKDGFTFDLGPSIFTLPQIFRDLFTRAGKNLDDYLTLVPVTPHWRNFFEDGTTIDLFQDPDQMRAELAKLPGDPEKLHQQFQNFLTYARKQYNLTESGYFEKGIDNLWEFICHYKFQLIGSKIDYKRTMAEAIAQHFDEPHLRLIFEYFIKYVGSSALNAPGYMNLMPIIQFDHGLWYVEGGMYNLATALEKLANEMDIQIHFNNGIKSINQNGKQVESITTESGETIPFHIVVSNMEVIPTYQKLLNEPETFTQKIDKKFAPACSGLVLHLGTDRIYPQLAHHNFFFSENQHKHFKTVFDQHRIPDDPTIYLVAPTRTDPSKAPDGCDNIKILPHIPPLQHDHEFTPQDYLDLEDRVLTKLERMGLTDLRKHTITRDVLTPYDIERMYASNRGAIYGVVTDWKKNYGFKAPKESKKYINLYFVGGSVNPGGGMPMVVLSGQKCADRIIKKHR